MSAASAAEPPRARGFLLPFSYVGGLLLSQLALVGQWALLGWQALEMIARRRVPWRQFLLQVEAIGIGSIPMAALTVTFSSMVLALYTVDQFIEYGLTDYVGELMAVSLVRELAPVLAAIVVASREGSAITAEIASMKVTEQIDALRSLATDPVEYLVVPRLLAAMLSMPLLTVLAGSSGAWGGSLIAKAKELPNEVYWSSIWRGVEPQYLFAGGVKALVFGALIAVIACHQGLHTGHGSGAVGQSTTRSVVLCILMVHVADLALALVFA